MSYGMSREQRVLLLKTITDVDGLTTRKGASGGKRRLSVITARSRLAPKERSRIDLAQSRLVRNHGALEVGA